LRRRKRVSPCLFKTIAQTIANLFERKKRAIICQEKKWHFDRKSLPAYRETPESTLGKCSLREKARKVCAHFSAVFLR
jgi:hypothetical protein